MRYFYTYLLYLMLPFIFIRLWWRGRRLPAYRQRWRERLGFYPFRLQSCLWIHAVSVGEVVAAAPLVEALLKKYPQYALLVTTMTPTGAVRVQALFGARAKHVYLPYDWPDALQRFLRAMQPMVGIIIETELWPNLLQACAKNTIPMYLLNARLSEKSARGYQYIAGLARCMLRQLQGIAAQNQADAERLIALGAPAEHVTVTGNIKFDLAIPTDLSQQAKILRQSFGERKLIWIAASTHAGEEELILTVHEQIRKQYADALLILVPRHPDRFDAVADLCERRFALSGHSNHAQQMRHAVVVRRTQYLSCTQDTAIYLGDTMGELLLLYAAADIVFVGGSLIPHGGHNLLEPSVLGKPILTGSHIFNFREVSELLLAQHALLKVDGVNALAEQLIYLCEHPNVAVQMGQQAQQVIAQNKGALQKQIEMIRF